MSAPGGLTESSPGQTDRVTEIAARNNALARQAESSTDTSADVPAVDPHAMTTEEARVLTDEIKADAEALWNKVARAYIERAWDALGYESWDAYCTAEFGSARLRLPLEERQEVVCSLREAGMPIRAIASGVGISDQTVQRDLKAGVVNHYTSPEEPNDPIDAEVVEDHAAPAIVTGVDGKSYPKSKPTPTTNKQRWHRRRKPFPGRFGVGVADLDRSVEKLQKLTADDRFRDFARSEVGATRRTKLLRLIATLQAVADQFPNSGGAA